MKRESVKTLLVIIFLTKVSTKRIKGLPDYCSDNSCKNGHTICMRGYDCDAVGDCLEIDSDFEFRQQMVREHNKYRQKIASGEEKRGGNTGATNMNIISYDLELEYIAQCWADTCQPKHDNCRNVRRFGVGQNIYVITEPDWKSGPERWYEEIRNISNVSIIDRYIRTKPTIEHFTAMVWARTRYVGCARSRKNRTYFLICNYGPMGNVLTKSIYKRGAPGRDCEITSKEYASLCEEMDPIPSEESWYKVYSREQTEYTERTEYTGQTEQTEQTEDSTEILRTQRKPTVKPIKSINNSTVTGTTSKLIKSLRSSTISSEDRVAISNADDDGMVSGFCTAPTGSNELAIPKSSVVQDLCSSSTTNCTTTTLTCTIPNTECTVSSRDSAVITTCSVPSTTYTISSTEYDLHTTSCSIPNAFCSESTE